MRTNGCLKVALYGNTLDYYFIKRIKKNTNTIGQLDKVLFKKGAGILNGDINKYSRYEPIINKEIILNSEISPYYSIKKEPKVISESKSFKEWKN